MKHHKRKRKRKQVTLALTDDEIFRLLIVEGVTLLVEKMVKNRPALISDIRRRYAQRWNQEDRAIREIELREGWPKWMRDGKTRKQIQAALEKRVGFPTELTTLQSTAERMGLKYWKKQKRRKKLGSVTSVSRRATDLPPLRHVTKFR